jgi:hypothetical protein
MTHLSEEQLVLYYYSEPDETADVESHLEQCDSCRANYAALQRTLNLVDTAPVAERGPGYADRVWARLTPALRRKRFWLMPRRWMAPVGIAAMLVLAFLAGRFSQRPQRTTATTAAAPGQVRERILLVAVGDHLDRSQMVLVELLNADPHRPLDITSEQQRAGDLVEENRLYRQTAQRTGDAGVAGVLDELERVLLDVARGPSELTPEQLAQFQQRIQSQGLLFKIRVLGTNVRQKEQKSL